MKEKSAIAHIFSSDAPKAHPEEDELGRAQFCEEIARSLASWRSSETFVVSLSGQWGSGKTTLCNFIKHYLKKQDPEALCVDFNPWEWSGQDKIFEGFFYQIGALFRKSDELKKTRRLLKRWQGLAITLKVGGAITAGLSKWISGAAGLLVFLGVIGGAALKNPDFTEIVGVVASLCLLSSLFDLPENLATYVQGLQKNLTLDDLRDEIAEELRKLNRPIIVFIDDIDRLTDSEILLLFQLVKANIRLPNVVFFLMFQKSVVAKSIKKLISEDGERYLRKIIQVEWDIPNAPDGQIMQLLVDGIEKILAENSPKIEWEKTRWTNIFYEGLWPFFQNLRDINRFLGTLSFYFRLQVKGKVLEVNPVDLIAIETLRTFDNEAYIAIAKSKKWIEQIDGPFAKSDHLKEAQDRFTSIIGGEARSPEHKVALQVVLKELFPQAFSGLNDKDQFVRKLRISHHGHFDKYFRGVLDTENAYASQWAEFLDGMHDKARVTSIINRAIESGNLEGLLTQLWAGRSEIPIEAMLPITTALFDASDEFPIGRIGIGLFDPETTAQRFIRFRLLKEDRSVRTNLIKSALLESKGFSLPIDFIAMEDEASRKRNPEIDYVVDDAEAKWLESHGLGLLRKKALAGTLLEKENGGFNLAKWDNWSPAGEVQTWVSSYISTPANAFNFLRRLAGTSYSAGSEEQPILAAQYIEEYVPLESLQKLTDLVQKSELSEKDRKIKDLLSFAVSQKKSRLPYAQIHMDDIVGWVRSN